MKMEFKLFNHNYLVYSDGTVYSIRRKKFISPVMGKRKSKYFTVKVPDRIKLHRLVAQLFIPNPSNLPEVNHLNGIKSDCRKENLQWCTKHDNYNHALENNLLSLKGERSGRSKLKEIDVLVIRDAIKAKFSNKQIADYFKINPSTICDIKSRKSWSHI